MILEVCDKQLIFGCMKAIDENGNNANIMIYENINVWKLGYVPKIGDMLVCKNYHSNVYIPHKIYMKAHLMLRHLPIPYDVMFHYFPLAYDVDKYKLVEHI